MHTEDLPLLIEVSKRVCVIPLAILVVTRRDAYCLRILYSQVQTDGRLELEFYFRIASVLVFSADVDTRELGEVFFRESTDPDLLKKVDNIVGGLSDILPDFDTRPPTSLFITTWFNVGHYNRSTDEVGNAAYT